MKMVLWCSRKAHWQQTVPINHRINQGRSRSWKTEMISCLGGRSGTGRRRLTYASGAISCLCRWKHTTVFHPPHQSTRQIGGKSTRVSAIPQLLFTNTDIHWHRPVTILWESRTSLIAFTISVWFVNSSERLAVATRKALFTVSAFTWHFRNVNNCLTLNITAVGELGLSYPQNVVAIRLLFDYDWRTRVCMRHTARASLHPRNKNLEDAIV